MKTFNRDQYRLLSLIFTLTAILGLGINLSYASDRDSSSHETETSGGFCDCSTSGDLICHIPPGNRSNMHTIQVGSPAIDAHLAHGDTLGVCPGDDEDEYEHYSSYVSEEATETCVCEDGNIGKIYHAPAPLTETGHSFRSIHGK